jgi:hypothetical protein
MSFSVKAHELYLYPGSDSPLHTPVHSTTVKSHLIENSTHFFFSEENVHFGLHTSTYRWTELSVSVREGKLLEQLELTV